MKFKHLNINDGLSQNTVYATLQDYKGFIWIATEDGLNRFNGYEFKIYKHNSDVSSLSGNQINTLFEDRRHNLWIGTADGLNIYDRKKDRFHRLYTFSKGSLDINDAITDIIEDTKGRIWVGTFNGLKLYDPASGHFTAYAIDNPRKDKRLNKIQSVLLDNANQLWVGTGGDLRIFDVSTRRFVGLPRALENNATLRHAGIRRIRRDNKGSVWIATENAGLFYYDPSTGLCSNFVHHSDGPYGLLSNMVRDILLPGNGEVWAGTREGLSILTPGAIRNFTYDKYDPDGLSFNSVRSLMKDKAGNIWVGTYAGGVDIFFPESRNFLNITEQMGTRPGLSERIVSAVIHNGDGSMWLGTEGGGLNFVDVQKGQFNHYDLSAPQTISGNNTVKSLCKDPQGDLWIGAYNGLYRFDVHSRHFVPLNIAGLDTSAAGRQFYAVNASGKNLLFGTNGAGLEVIYGTKALIYRHDAKNKASLSNNNITCIQYAGGNYWIGTQRGLNYFDPNTGLFKQIKHTDGKAGALSNNTILTLFIDHQKQLWVGTEGGGLDRYDASASRFTNISEKDGLANGVIHAIAQDRKGNIWVSTNSGISMIALIPHHKVHITNYSIADGLATNQFSSGAADISPDGKLIFGSIAGITVFDPSKILVNRYKPPVVITDLLIRNRPVLPDIDGSPLTNQINETSKLTLSHEQNFVSFKFAALNYMNADNNQYAYRLYGFKEDNDWHYVGSQRMATYTNLDPGNYIFQVKAANNDGVWSGNIKSIRLTILPPWWRTWWAYVTYVAIIVTLLYLFYYYSVKTERLTSELKFEHLSRQKDQELTERKLSFFTNISHEIKTPLTLILAPLEKVLNLNEGNNKMQNQLMLMQNNGERLIRLINQLLDFSKFDEGNMKLLAAKGDVVNFLKEIVLSFQGYAKSKHINLSIHTDAKQIELFFDRDKLEKIFYNLLSNAIKFTADGGTVSLNLSIQDGRFVAEVTDNGIGIAPEHITGIFDRFNQASQTKQHLGGSGIGLSFSKGLAELHYGTITVTSTQAKPGQRGYTCFKVTLPLGSSHLKSDEIITETTDGENIEQYYPSISKSHVRIEEVAESSNAIDHPVMLVVEDNKEVLDFIVSNFNNAFNVHCASDGAEGLRLAIEIVPDIVISDVMMPKMNGIELCSRIKTDVRTSHIPVILLTARTPLIFKVEGLETGADDYITKPFSLEVLEARVRNLIDSRKKLRERYSREISLQPQNIAITSADEKFLTRIISFIESNIDNTSLNVDDLGKAVGMSRATLYRKLKALTNQTALELIRDLRIKRAGQLLGQNKFNVSEVAYMVGFIDVDYFRKCFKEHYGFTPTEFIQADATHTGQPAKN